MKGNLAMKFLFKAGDLNSLMINNKKEEKKGKNQSPPRQKDSSNTNRATASSTSGALKGSISFTDKQALSQTEISGAPETKMKKYKIKIRSISE